MSPLEAVSFMKQHGILHLRNGDLEITLQPAALLPEVPERPIVKEDNRRGKGGQTRQEQIDLYGQVFEEDFIGLPE